MGVLFSINSATKTPLKLIARRPKLMYKYKCGEESLEKENGKLVIIKLISDRTGLNLAIDAKSFIAVWLPKACSFKFVRELKAERITNTLESVWKPRHPELVSAVLVSGQFSTGSKSCFASSQCPRQTPPFLRRFQQFH